MTKKPQSKMIYKDSKFEIDDRQFKFKNGIFFPLLIIFNSIFTTSLIFSKGNILFTASSLIGLIIGFLIIRLFVGMYLKNTIDLTDIDCIKAQIWDNSVDENRDFWGIGKYKYHFPTGLNRKANPKVIFVHIKERKAAVGFVPENIENAISVLKERGIKVIEKTI